MVCSLVVLGLGLTSLHLKSSSCFYITLRMYNLKGPGLL